MISTSTGVDAFARHDAGTALTPKLALRGPHKPKQSRAGSSPEGCRELASPSAAGLTG